MKKRTVAAGFTIVELIVVITLIGIIAGLVTFVPQNLQKSASANEQASDTASIARRLESAYSSQDIGSPSYPSTVELLTDISGRTRTMTRTNPEIFIAPSQTGSSVVAATAVTTTNPAGANTPTLNQYVYQPLASDGSLCTASPSATNETTQCTRFNLFYRSALSNTVIVVKSLHQQ